MRRPLTKRKCQPCQPCLRRCTSPVRPRRGRGPASGAVHHTACRVEAVMADLWDQRRDMRATHLPLSALGRWAAQN